MVKHTASHGFAVLGSTIVSALLIEAIKPLVPNFFLWFENQIRENLLKYLPSNLSPKYVTIIILATLLGLLWGWFFKKRFDRN